MNASMRPTMGPTMGDVRRSMHPTLVPSSRSTVLPRAQGSFVTEPPSTQRSATVHPRFEAAARHDAKSLLATLRLDVQFLGSLVEYNGSPLAVDALKDIHHSIDRLENRIGSWSEPRRSCESHDTSSRRSHSR